MRKCSERRELWASRFAEVLGFWVSGFRASLRPNDFPADQLLKDILRGALAIRKKT